MGGDDDPMARITIYQPIVCYNLIGIWVKLKGAPSLGNGQSDNFDGSIEGLAPKKTYVYIYIHIQRF